MNACVRLRRLVLPGVLGIGAAAAAFAAPLDPTPEIILDRAITAMGGPSALEAVKEIRIVWVGTQDLWAVYQGRYADKGAPDDVYAELQAHFTPEEQVKLTMLIGIINAWNRFGAGFRAVHALPHAEKAAA